MSGWPHGHPADDTDPIHTVAIVAHEFDRLPAIGTVGHDHAIRPVERDRGLSPGPAAVRAILHEQRPTLQMDDIGVARTLVGAEIRLGIRLPPGWPQPRQRFPPPPSARP